MNALAESAELTEEEVLDIDEEAYREDHLPSRLYGYLVMPEKRGCLQAKKMPPDPTPLSRLVKTEIAEHFVKEIDPKILYLLGPVTTGKAMAVN